MNKKIILLIACLTVGLGLTSCVKDQALEDKEEEPPLEDLEEFEEEDLDTEEILDLVLNRRDERENYSLEYRSSYSFKGEAIDLDDEDFEKLDFKEGQIEPIEIEELDKIYHYQDGRGSYKTYLQRDDGDKRGLKIISYNKDRFILYDSDLVEEGEDPSIYKVWKDIMEGTYDHAIPGFFFTDSREELEDYLTFSRVDYPRNPLQDSIDLLDIYNYSDMYRVKRLRESENKETYVLNLISYEENVDIVFYIDREDFYIRSYRGNNGEAVFQGQVVSMERYVDYDRDFFDIPNIR